jgi:hypothetical protein
LKLSEKTFLWCRAENRTRACLTASRTIIASDNSTGDKFFAGINVTGEQLSPVTTTSVIKFFPGVGDSGHKNPKSLKFFDGVNDTAENYSLVSLTPVIRQSCLC